MQFLKILLRVVKNYIMVQLLISENSTKITLSRQIYETMSKRGQGSRTGHLRAGPMGRSLGVWQYPPGYMFERSADARQARYLVE